MESTPPCETSIFPLSKKFALQISLSSLPFRSSPLGRVRLNSKAFIKWSNENDMKEEDLSYEKCWRDLLLY